MGRRTRECYLCGEKYSYCPTCSQDKNKPSWMAEFHSESCKNIFQICTNFNLGIQTKSEAKAALEQCDLSNKENFKSYVQNDLEVIFAEDVITVPVDVEIKEIHEDKVVVETSVRGSNKKKSHEVVIKQENE